MSLLDLPPGPPPKPDPAGATRAPQATAAAASAAPAPVATEAPRPAATPTATASAKPDSIAQPPEAKPAEAKPAATTTDDRAFTYSAGADPKDQRDGGVLMVEAYALVWILLMGWLVFLWRKQAGLHARLTELEKTLDRAAAARPHAAAPKAAPEPHEEGA